MRAVAIAIAAVTILAAGVRAQEASPRPEIGIRGGFAHYKDAGVTSTLFLTPGNAFATPAVVHLTWFVMPRVAVEPQVGYTRFSGIGPAMSTLSLGGQLMGFLREGGESPYAFAIAGTMRQRGGFEATQNAVGGGIGYRTVIADGLGLRVEGRYRRLTLDEDKTDELAALVGFGALIGDGESPAPEQDRAVEIGFRSGWARYKPVGSSLTFKNMSIPGQPAVSPTTVHATIFVDPRIAIEPHLSFTHAGDSENDSDSQSVIVLGGQLMALLSSGHRSPYGFAYGDINHATAEGGNDGFTQHSLGGGLGYRAVVSSSLALRLEGRYRRLFNGDNKLDELGVLIGVGALIGR